MFNKNNDKWLLYHIATHITITYEEYAIIYTINKSNVTHTYDEPGIPIEYCSNDSIFYRFL